MFFYNHYCLSESGAFWMNFFNWVIWIGIFVVIYLVMSLLFRKRVAQVTGTK